MIVTLIAPFSTTVAFDRKWMAYETAKAQAYFDREKTAFGASDVRLGKWLLPLVTTGRFYMDTDEPGELFREYFLATQKFAIEGTGLLAAGDWSGNDVALARPPEVSWLDKGFGCLTLKLNLSEVALHAQSSRQAQADFDRMVNAVADRVYHHLRPQINATTQSLFRLSYIHSTQSAFNLDASVVSDSLHWVHKVWSLGPDSDLLCLPGLISAPTLGHFDASRPSVWGWGDSIHVGNGTHPDAVSEDDWERGMLLAQYFHTILDHGIRQLPVQIEKMRLLIDRGSLRQAQVEAEQYTYGINAMLTDFEIAQQLTAGPAREVLQSLTARWGTDKLRQGVVALVPYLKELITQSSETLKSWSQTSIETILFVSTVIGFFGLSIALHDYLTPTKERFDLSRLSLPHASVSDPLAIAGIFFLVSMLIFMLSKVGMILLLFNSLKYQMKPLRRFFNPFRKYRAKLNIPRRTGL